MDDSKRTLDQNLELNEDQLEFVVGGVITGGQGPLTDAYSGNQTDPGEVPPPVPPSDPKFGK